MANDKVDILAIGVHPDDVELSCAGTLLKQIHSGHTAAVVDLTKGELGTRGSATTRIAEADAAAKIMGITHRMNLGMRDGYFQHNEHNINKIISAIRRFRPKVVLANAVRDRHPDHGRASKLIADACYYSGLAKISTTYNRQAQEKWRPDAVYHYIQDYSLKPDLIVDVSGFESQKLKAIMAYKTQFFDPNSAEPNTPISSQAFMDILMTRMQEWGRLIGVSHAEAYTCARPIGTSNLLSLL